MAYFVSILLLIIPINLSYGSSYWLDQIYSKKPKIDTNGDQQVDIWRTFDSSGKLTEVHYDTNFDFKKDKWTKYYETKTTDLSDTDFDGKIDESVTRYFTLSLKGKKILTRTVRKRNNVITQTEDYIEEKEQIKKINFKNGKKDKVVYKSAIRY